jgi:hypothetical protein
MIYSSPFPDARIQQKALVDFVFANAASSAADRSDASTRAYAKVFDEVDKLSLSTCPSPKEPMPPTRTPAALAAK